MHRSDTDYRPFARALEMLAALALALAPVAGASAAPPSTAVAQEAARLERWIAESAPSTWTARYGATASESADGTPQGGVRIEVTVGRVDPRIKLESCARFEPFLPSHARLWGRSHIGVRCVEGESWTTLVPVTVSVFGTALVANLPIPAGAPADPADFSLREVDLTRTVGIPVADPELLAGRSLGRSFSAGQMLRANDLRVPRTVSAGDPIRIRLIGQGFAVSAEGFAMAAAGEGEPLRVRTGSGKMLVGIVRERILEVRL
jgi:flagella basal body P-ring formation protein FlgA